MLRLEEEDDKMLRLIESSGAGINLFVVSFTIACVIAISFQLSFCIGARAHKFCEYKICVVSRVVLFYFSCKRGHVQMVTSNWFDTPFLCCVLLAVCDVERAWCTC